MTDRASRKAAGALAAISVLLVSAHVPGEPPEYYLQDWSTRDLGYFGDPGQWQETRALCAGVADAVPPAADLPTAADRAALKGCSSEALYYGIGTMRDPSAARKCAFLEIERNMEETRSTLATPFEFFDAHGMLAVIYANGTGAERDLDLALHAACRLEHAPMAMESRIRHLDRLRSEGPGDEPFSICDDITSGISMGICAGHFARVAQQQRTGWLQEWQAGWTQQQRGLFAAAYESFAAYAEISHELDCFRGTMAAACSISGTERDVQDFLERLEALVAHRPLPRRERVEEGDVTRDTGARPATATQEEFGQILEGLDAHEAGVHLANQRNAIAARKVFEPRLIAFLKSVRPDLTSRQVRVLFRDL